MNRLPPTARLIGIGWYFAVCVVGGLAGGFGLDALAGTRPLLTVLGLFLGLAIAFYGGYHMIKDSLGTQMRTTGKKDRQ